MNDKLEDLLNIGHSPEQPLNVSWANRSNCSVSVKRDDLLHQIISGNKWRKLKYALQEILANTKESQCLTILSFGGGYSNHIHALAYCCHQLSNYGRAISFNAIIRGDYSANVTPMLNDIISWGANIKYVDRDIYNKRHEKAYLDTLTLSYQNKANSQVSIIPEGGSQHSALPGIQELFSELNNHYDYILCPVASGGTMAGLINAAQSLATKVVGVAVLKGENYLEKLITELLPAECSNDNWVIEHGFHFGGYAKKTPNLSEFCTEFHTESGINIEPVYSGKLFFALKQLITHNYFPSNSRILVVHTGGLQGARGGSCKLIERT